MQKRKRYATKEERRQNMQRVEWKDETEYYGRLPRTLEEAFGPGPQSRLALDIPRSNARSERRHALWAALIFVVLMLFVSCRQFIR